MEKFFENLCIIYRPLIEKNLQARGATSAESKDCASEAFIWLWKKFRSEGFTPDLEEDYIKQLYTVSRNKWYDYTRSGHYKNLRLEGNEEKLATVKPSDEIDGWTVLSSQKLIRSVFLKWDERKGKLLYMRHFLGASNEDLAEDFNLASAGSVGVTCSNAKTDFQDWLSPNEPLAEKFKDAIVFWVRNKLWGPDESDDLPNDFL